MGSNNNNNNENKNNYKWVAAIGSEKHTQTPTGRALAHIMCTLLLQRSLSTNMETNVDGQTMDIIFNNFRGYIYEKKLSWNNKMIHSGGR